MQQTAAQRRFAAVRRRFAAGHAPGGASDAASRGLSALITAFTIWGLLPLYLRELSAVPAGQIMAYRLVLCCVVVLGFLALRGELGSVHGALRQPGTRLRLGASALLISLNWLLYVWAIQNGRVIESSLGYFINPLVNVLLGVLVLRERLSRVQWGAVALAAAGVVYLTWQAGAPPWIALVLALSFGGYGLVRKTIAVDSLAGLGSETLLLTPFGLAYLAWCELSGHGVLRVLGPWPLCLLLLSGVATAVPLALFSYGARRVRLSTVGVCQYIGPSIQLGLGIVLFAEPFGLSRAIGFALIWAALALYAGNGLWQGRQLAARALIVLLICASPQLARANGAFPDSLAVLLPEDRPEQIFVATNFGLVRSDDDGASWGVICEEVVGNLAELYAVGPPPSSRVLAITLDGLVVSNDGACSFQLVPPPLVFPADAFVDPSDPEHVLAVAQVTRSERNRVIQGVFESHDGAASFDWTPLYVAEDNVNFAGLEIARNDPNTIYATLYQYDGDVGALLLRSHDAGRSFGTVDLRGVLGRKLARILAIDPEDPQRVYLRAYDSSPSELLVIYDGAAGSVEIAYELPHRMSAFLRRSDGALLIGTREDGGFISRDGGASFARWRGAPHLRGLGERRGRLYAVADDLVDGYALAISDDQGKSWQPALRYEDITGPFECGAVPTVCAQPWKMVQDRLDAGPGEGEAPGYDAGTGRDAGTTPDAGSEARGDRSHGCDCRLGRGRTPSLGPALVLLVLLRLLRRRARRAARA